MELKKGDLVCQKTFSGTLYGTIITHIHRYKGIKACKVAWTSGIIHMIDINFLDKVKIT